MIVLPQVVLKVAGGLGLLRGWLPEQVAGRLPVFPGWEIPLTGLTVHEKEVILQVFHFKLILYGYYVALPIIRTILTEIPGLPGNPLDCVD